MEFDLLALLSERHAPTSDASDGAVAQVAVQPQVVGNAIAPATEATIVSDSA